MKNFLLIIFIFSLFFNVKAQCPITEAVDFTTTDIHGNSINLFEILDGGQYVLIDFFNTACGPCATIAPYIQESYESFGCNDFDIVFISIDKGNDNASCLEFGELNGINIPCISGQEGGGTEIHNNFQIPYVPLLILIAPDHSIILQEITPINNALSITSLLEKNGVVQHECVNWPVADFLSDIQEVCSEGYIQFNSISTGDITSWNWEFEGGNPATSTDENPLVTFAIAGNYNVSLTVSDGTTSNTKLIEDYILTNPLPEVTFAELPKMCVNYPAYKLIEGAPDGGIYSGDFVTDGFFDPADAGVGEHNLIYTFIDNNGCENSAEIIVNVDACSGINNLNKIDFTVLPNPTTNLVVIEAKEMIELSIFSIDGQLIYKTPATEKVEIATSEWSSGIYLVQIKTENRVETSKLVKR